MVKRIAENSITENEDDLKIVDEKGKVQGVNNANPKKRLKTRSLYRQPTVNELNRLQETENLFNSNLFRLQIEEILLEVQVKEKTEKKFQEWFLQLKDHLLSICEDGTEYNLTEPTLHKKLKVKLPISTKLDKTKCVFKFLKFDNVEIAGSYSLGCSINSKLKVDLQITVPADTYTKNDSINYRYHKKRAAYLACIAAHLKNYEGVENLQYSWINGCETRPVLDLTPTGKLGKHMTVRIDLKSQSEAYKLHRFSPSRNNLRESWLLSENAENNTEVGPPTPFYNSSILCDQTAAENNSVLEQTLMNSENLKQSIVLLKIWLRQRNLQVSGYIINMFIVYLVQNRRINNIMSSYQIVRNVWIALKTSEWDTKGISLCKSGNTPPIEEFHECFPVVFLDTTGYYNICWQMCKGTYAALKRESVLAVDMLDNGKINSFLPLFMMPVQPLLQFDHILRFKNIQHLIESVTEKVPKSVKLNYGVEKLSLVTDTLYTLLARALGNRVDLILQLVDADFSWSVKKKPDKAMKEGYKQEISFGFILNPENCLNIVEKGPPANLPEAEEFRSFWGDKSELRRFQDGSITETCVWEADTLADRRGVSRQIVDYLFKLKYDIPSSELFHIHDQLESLVFRKQYSAPCEESTVRVVQALDNLRRDIRLLTQLPLDVSAVYGHSGKWPGDIEAFRCLKSAFNLQIAERLNKQHSTPTQAYPTHIDVLKDGLVFRLEIAHPKEITLLRKEMEKGVAKFRETEESVKLQCDTVLMPRLRGALHGLHQKHPAYGPTCCLLKRWLSCHLVPPPHFPAPVAELVAAATFLRPHPSLPTVQPTAGLYRVWRLLAETNWATEMIVLDFNEDMRREEITELETAFSSREDKSPRLYIVTAYDGDLPSVWSSIAPSPNVLARVKTLARSALDYVTQALLEDMKDNVLGTFVPSLAGYDVIIHLNSSLVPYAGEKINATPVLKPVAEVKDTEVIPVVEFDPVRKYLEELQSAYSEFALFFHDSYGGDVIAVLWKPDVHNLRDFQLTNANALVPVTVKGETKYKINTRALIEDFKILGDGLVRDVVVNS
ncbi:hypothetical protein evm_010040 [Chilo suppressalis]|nr:hypothetical protein evm_010040 [Chilo suppressalis]